MESNAAKQERIEPADLAELMNSVTAAIAKSYELERRSAAPRQNVYASEWRECERRMVLEVLYAHELEPPDADAIARMTRGSEREVDIRVRLERAGKLADPPFEVRGAQQRFEYKSKGRVVLSMKIDGELFWPSTGLSIPWEGKALSQFLMSKIKTGSIYELEQSRWTRHIPRQILAYLLTMNRPAGALVFDRPGLPLIAPISLYDNMDMAEDFLARAERTMETVDVIRGTEGATLAGIEGLLPAHSADPTLCEVCPLRDKKCFPTHWQRGAVVPLDEELLEAEKAYWETIDAAERFDAAEKILKGWAKAQVADIAIVGQSVVKVTERNVKGFQPKYVEPRTDRIVKIARPAATLPTNAEA